MGYRSYGYLWLDKQVVAPEEVQNLLNKFDEYNKETNVYSFEDWKWYISYKEVQIVENFLEALPLELWDFEVVGEDGDIVYQPRNIGKIYDYKEIQRRRVNECYRTSSRKI